MQNTTHAPIDLATLMALRNEIPKAGPRITALVLSPGRIARTPVGVLDPVALGEMGIHLLAHAHMRDDQWVLMSGDEILTVGVFAP